MEKEVKVKVWLVQVGGRPKSRKYLSQYTLDNRYQIPHVEICTHDDVAEFVHRRNPDWIVGDAIEKGAMPYRTEAQAQKALDSIAKEVEGMDVDLHFLTIEEFRVHGAVIEGEITI